MLAVVDKRAMGSKDTVADYMLNSETCQSAF
jgi:hypothetical protein